jgi:riboflavin-specific deaminase-like protein
VIDKSLKEIALIVIPLLTKYKKFFIAQLGQSLDGKIALFNGNSHYINSQKSILYLHALRCICDGLLVGVNTVINDNPLLTTRYMTGSSPMRIIIDPSLKLTNRLNIFKDGNKNIVFTQKASKKTLNNTTIYKLPKKNFTKSVYQKIIDLNFNYILVEGGATTISNFLEQELLDIMQFIIAPIIIGSGIDSIKLKSISTLKNALRPKSHLYKLGDEIIASLEF